MIRYLSQFDPNPFGLKAIMAVRLVELLRRYYLGLWEMFDCAAAAAGVNHLHQLNIQLPLLHWTEML